MFEALSDRLAGVFRSIRGRGKITESNVREALAQIQTALLEADVNVDIARSFVDECQKKALGMQVIDTLRPDQVLVKVVNDELVALMGPVDTRIPFVSQPPTVLLMAGLQGSGKTTTCAKLARFCLQRGKKPMLVAADLKRPAAIDQLEVLGQQLSIPVFAQRDHQNPVKVCRDAIQQSRTLDRDVVILDTAGRLAIDDELMNELSQVAKATSPHQIYLVLDAMTGQDAVNTARVFDKRLELDGVILTKFDSDTRGGAALSVKKVTGKPIKFIGVGEKLDALEEFHPERIAGRILGMGDVVSLVEKAQGAFDEEQAAKAQAKMAKGTLGFDDFLGMFESFRKLGPMKSVLKMIPGMGNALNGLDVKDEDMNRMRGIIHAMTIKERRSPELIEASRRRRIARGAGVDPQEVSGLVKNFLQMKPLMKQMSSFGLGQRMPNLEGLNPADLLGGNGAPKPKLGGGKFDPRKREKEQKRKRRR